MLIFCLCFQFKIKAYKKTDIEDHSFYLFLLKKTQIDFKSKKMDEKEVNFKYFNQLGNFTEYLAINPFYNNQNEANEKKIHLHSSTNFR